MMVCEYAWAIKQLCADNSAYGELLHLITSIWGRITEESNILQ